MTASIGARDDRDAVIERVDEPERNDSVRGGTVL
jgi:hypothetical protein